MGARTWTDERIERAKEMWSAGYSAGDIAREFGDKTRCAVIGKIHRLLAPFPDLRKRNSRPKPKVERKPRAPKITRCERVCVAAITKQVDPAMLLLLDKRTGRSLSFDQAFREHKLTPDCCKWIVGHVGEGDWFYCGEATEWGSYCGRHAAVAHQALA